MPFKIPTSICSFIHSFSNLALGSGIVLLFRVVLKADTKNG